MQRVGKYWIVVLLLVCTVQALNLKGSLDSGVEKHNTVGESVDTGGGDISDTHVGDGTGAESSFAQPRQRVIDKFAPSMRMWLNQN